MISVEKAIDLIKKNTKHLPAKKVTSIDSLGKVLAKHIFSPVHLPPFDQSAMDGYAINFNDFIKFETFKVIGEVAAGKSFNKKINSGEAVRIFTGAPVPKGTNAVVMQEKTELIGNEIKINDDVLQYGSNVRKAGSQIKKNKKALTQGSIISPGGIGYIAAMGIRKVDVISSPKITVIVTGTELKKPGEKLKDGQIYESNSLALIAALKSINLNIQKIETVIDDEKEVYNSIKKAINSSDLVLITGGISVGNYDFTGNAFKKIGVKNIFYKIKQKPGKPLFYGQYKNTAIFGLPGNPAAVLSCFYEYVYPSVRIMQGRKDVFLKKTILPISKDYNKKKGLSLFLKAKIIENAVIPLEGQESYVLSSFADADSIIFLPENSENIKKDELVEVHLLPAN